MLEIIALIFLCRKIGKKAFDKGYSKGLFIFLTVVFWIGGEFAGAIIGYLVMGKGGMGPYLFALIGAACGYGFIYLIANNLKDNKQVDNADVIWKEQNTTQNPS